MQPTTPEERAARRADQYTRFLWHWATFVVFNALLWVIDWGTGSGIEWAYWVTVPWVLVIGIHAGSVFIDGHIKDRLYHRFLEEEQQKQRNQQPKDRGADLIGE